MDSPTYNLAFTELATSESHQFHLLNYQQAYCTCSWISEIPDGWEAINITEMQRQWRQHIETETTEDD